MSVTDPIADMLTQVRNASAARHERVDVVGSRLALALADVLKREGFIRSYKVLEATPAPGKGRPKTLRIYLKYTSQREPVMTQLMRVSKAGRRRYVRATRIPRVQSGMGVAILSTSQGLMTDSAARKAGVGGELICYVI